jgi:hypothetical protein
VKRFSIFVTIISIFLSSLIANFFNKKEKLNELYQELSTLQWIAVKSSGDVQKDGLILNRFLHCTNGIEKERGNMIGKYISDRIELEGSKKSARLRAAKIDWVKIKNELRNPSAK